MLGAMIVPAFATSPSNSDLLSNNWKVLNGMPATNSFWDINKAQYDGTSVSFPVQQFLSTSTGSFAIYLENNYNVDLTGKTITAAANWTPGTYATRSTVFPGAYGRVEFQDVASSSFTSSDYWWYNNSSLDLNGVTSGTITAPLTDRAHWTNICGQVATDTTVNPAQPNCVGGTDPAGSPYDGFTNAMKDVKKVSLSFGSAGSYASGVALVDGTGTFNMTGFTIAP